MNVGKRLSLEMRMNGVLVLLEGIDSTIFTSQVSQHTLNMNASGIQMRILAFEPNRKNMSKSQENLQQLKQTYPELDIRLYRCVHLFLPFAMVLNTVLIWWRLRTMNGEQSIDFIHARADHCACLCLLQNGFSNRPVVWDCRGDSRTELASILSRALPKKLSMARHYFMLRQALILKVCTGLAESAIFVSEKLRDQFPKFKGRHVAVIPCSVSDDLFFDDPSLRKAQRSKWGVAEADIVVLYAGGVAAYQGFDRLAAFFRKHVEAPGVKIRLVTPDPEAAKTLFPTPLRDQIAFQSAKFHEMNGIYNGADIGVMLRDPSAINSVASPTKFGEYCMAGLPVVSNDTVDQVAQQTREIGNHISVDAPKLSQVGGRDRTLISQKARSFFGRLVCNRKYVDFYGKICGPQKEA
jgi:glycosyltransferase involved in cell wall biosynthesis